MFIVESGFKSSIASFGFFSGVNNRKGCVKVLVKIQTSGLEYIVGANQQVRYNIVKRFESTLLGFEFVELCKGVAVSAGGRL